MKKGNKNRLTGLILPVTIYLLAIPVRGANQDSLSLSPNAKKLKLATQSIYDEKTRKRGIKDLWKLAKISKRNRVDDKFVIGCQALGLLSRVSRHAVGYEKEKHILFLPPIKEFKETGVSSLNNKEIVKIGNLLQDFDNYSAISNWGYQKKSSEKFSNPQLLPFIELAYLKAIAPSIGKKEGASLKDSLKMLTYAESHTEGLDKAETLCQFGELLRELKEFKRAETYLHNALDYGNQCFKREDFENSSESKNLPGMAEWNKLKTRIKRLLFLLSFDLLKEDYGEAYATYVKIRSFCDKEEWWRAFPLAIKLKDEYPDTVYGEYGRFAWCCMLLGNDKAEEMKDKSLPSGIKELEKFIKETPYGLYRGEALKELGKFYLEYKYDCKQASKYYSQALEWFRKVRKQKDLVDLYAVPPKVKNISAPQGKLSNLNKWRLTEYRKINPKEIINSKTAPTWYISENEKDCLVALGFLSFVEGNYEQAKQFYAQIQKVDSNIAYLVKNDWPNACWRLIASCNVKKMLFDEKQRKFLKGKNKLFCAYGELKYLTENSEEGKKWYNKIINNPKSTANEKAMAYIGMTACMSTSKFTENYYLEAKKFKIHPLLEEELIRRMMIYYSYSSATQDKAYKMSSEYLKKFKEGKYIKEALFRKGFACVRLNRFPEAERILLKLESTFPQYSSNRILSEFIKRNKKRN